MPKWIDTLKEWRACPEAIAWANQYPTAIEAWEACERADWLLWVAGKLNPHGQENHQAIVRAACGCARTALQYLPPGEDRPLAAIEAAEAWATNPILANHEAAAATVAWAAAVLWATDPAAAAAAWAADATAAAVAMAADAAGAVGWATSAARNTAEAVGAAAKKDMANIVRSFLTIRQTIKGYEVVARDNEA